MSLLPSPYDDYHRYWETRYRAISKRLVASFRYVEPCETNRSAYSYEFASILRDACSLFDSTMKQLFGKERASIRDYKKWFGAFPAKHELIAVLRHADGYVEPLKELRQGCTPPWWKACNCIKHDEYKARVSGNLENAVLATCATAFLSPIIGWQASKDEPPGLFSAGSEHEVLLAWRMDCDVSTVPDLAALSP